MLTIVLLHPIAFGLIIYILGIIILSCIIDGSSEEESMVFFWPAILIFLIIAALPFLLYQIPQIIKYVKRKRQVKWEKKDV